MSLTMSPGITQARQWIAVATAFSEYLEQLGPALQKPDGSLPPIPRGALEGAMRFFSLVRDGIEQQKKSNGVPSSTPPMAGISNLSIAARLIAPTIASPSNSLDAIDVATAKFSHVTEWLRDGKARSVKPEDLKALAGFVRDLERQGLSEELPDVDVGPNEHGPAADTD